MSTSSSTPTPPWTVAVVAQIILAPTAGLLISAFGVEVAFAVNAASYLTSAAVLHRLPVGDRAAATERTSRRTALAAGVHAVLSNPLLARLLPWLLPARP